MVFSGKETIEPNKTEVLIGNDTIIKKTLETFSRTKKSMEASFDRNGPAIHVLYPPVWGGLISLKEKGVKLRSVTEITLDNIFYCKKLMEFIEIRHLDGIRTNFGIADGQEVLLHGISQETNPLSHAILTNVKGIVDAQQYMFENLWNKAIPGDYKVKEIEEGVKPDIIETITDPLIIQNLYLNLICSSSNEIMLIIPIIHAIYRHLDIGILDQLKKAEKFLKNNINVRILITSNANCHYLEQKIKSMNFPFDIQIRKIETDSTIKSSIIIRDNKESLVIELKNDAKNTFIEAIGFATYSNSRPTVLSYVSVFESFWNQSDILNKLKESEELQKDFIHIAAHELKNPIQPILGISKLLIKVKPCGKELDNMLNIINRNAKKLIQLMNDILDVTKIDSNNLNLNREIFDLQDLLSEIIQDHQNQLDPNYVKLKVKFVNLNNHNEENNTNNEKIMILADKTRINQVISNLINNAVKFTIKGNIDILVEKNIHNKISINVRDNGLGIDKDIFPKLFSKFSTKSKGGTGLGLFISKSIIKSHGEQMWAMNNKEDKGATFGFSLSCIN